MSDIASKEPGPWGKPIPWERTVATFDDLIAWLTEVNAGRWHWCQNSQCKYVEIKIDTRSGAYGLQDRDGKSLTLDELKRQGWRNHLQGNSHEQ